jgi:hypothetical protein
LSARGFDRVASFPAAESPASVFGHHVILASPSEKEKETAQPQVVVAAPVATVVAEVPEAPRPIAPAPAPVALKLAALTNDERLDALQDVVTRHVVRVMRLRPGTQPPSAHDRLMNIGVDSLMAVELKKQLTREFDGAVAVPSTLIFDYPTIAAIAGFLLTALGLAERDVPESKRAAPPAPAMSAIADLSDDEVEAMLAEQLKGFNA